MSGYVWPHARPSAWWEFRRWLARTGLQLVVYAGVLAYSLGCWYGLWLAVAWLWRNA